MIEYEAGAGIQAGALSGANVVNTTNSNSNDSGGWQSCPPGELGRVAVRLRGRRRSRRLAQFVAAGAVLLIVAGTGYLQFGLRAPGPADDPSQSPGPEGFNYGGITCAGMHRVEAALKAGTLDAATLARVRKHVELCPQCKSFGKLLPDVRQTGHLPCADPNCPHHGRHMAFR